MFSRSCIVSGLLLGWVSFDGWFKSWVLDSVFGAGGGRGSVEAWYTSSLDVEEVLGATDSDVHLFVADVTKSLDTIDMEILDRVLSSLGLPGWFRNVFPVSCSCQITVSLGLVMWASLRVVL